MSFVEFKGIFYDCWVIQCGIRDQVLSKLSFTYTILSDMTGLKQEVNGTGTLATENPGVVTGAKNLSQLSWLTLRWLISDESAHNSERGLEDSSQPQELKQVNQVTDDFPYHEKSSVRDGITDLLLWISEPSKERSVSYPCQPKIYLFPVKT